MQLEQIIIRPNQDAYIIQYTDNTGRAANVVLKSGGNTPLAAVVADAQQRIPKEQDRPDKSEIEQEIAELEYRLTQLKKSIGAA